MPLGQRFQFVEQQRIPSGLSQQTKEFCTSCLRFAGCAHQLTVKADAIKLSHRPWIEAAHAPYCCCVEPFRSMTSIATSRLVATRIYLSLPATSIACRIAADPE